MYLLNLSKVIVSALNPPTAWMISQSCSSLNPYLNCSLMYLSSSMVSSPLPCKSYKLKLAPLPSSLNGFPWIKIKNYDSGSQSLQELFEVYCITWALSNFVEDSEDDVILGIKSKSSGGQEKISDINSSLSGISIEWEQSVDFGDGVRGEDGVFSGDILGEDSLEVFGLNLSSAHWILKIQYILIRLFISASLILLTISLGIV